MPSTDTNKQFIKQVCMGVCVSDVALSPLHARLVDCQRVNSAGNRVGYLSSLGYPGILGYLGTFGYCRVLASLVHSAYWLHMKLMRDRSTYEFLAINSQHSAQKSVLKMFIILTGMQHTHSHCLCVCVCLLHVCTFAPLSRGAFWPRHAPVARCPCPRLSPLLTQ